MHVHIRQGFDSDWIEALRSSLHPDITLTYGKHGDVPSTCELLVAGRPSSEDLSASEHLKAVIVPWAGIPKVTGELLAARPHLSLHNLHHNAAPTAELAIALMLAAMKRVPLLDRALRRGDWRERFEDNSRLLLVEGRTALVLGYGAIGKRVARACTGLGMKVQAVRRGVDQDRDAWATIHSSEELPALLPFADVLMVCVPLTVDTEGLLDSARLAMLPDNAVIVNVSRGSVVDGESLYRELLSGRLRAGLDVWYTYPESEAVAADTAPSGFPFHELENVVMTPHLGGNSDRTELLRRTELARLLNAAAEGREVPNRVDLTRGY